MIQLSMVMEQGQDLPVRLQRWGDVELHASMVRVANAALALYLPQLQAEAPSGTKSTGDLKLNESFMGRVQDLGLEVNANFYTGAPQKLSWVTQGTRPHVIVPVNARALRFEPTLSEGYSGYAMYAENPGIHNKNQFVNRIKDRIRAYVQYRYKQEIDVSVTRL